MQASFANTLFTKAIVECPVCEEEMHASMDMCEYCIEDSSNFVIMSQRVLIHTRRNFKYGN